VLSPQVRGRIESKKLTPIGSAAKALENLKVKIASLELPPRLEGAPDPAQLLLSLASSAANSSSGGPPAKRKRAT
jgi:hypothetical protein